MPRFICTKENPYTPEKAKSFNGNGFSEHPEAVEEDGASDYFAYYFCPNCSSRWKEELPE